MCLLTFISEGSLPNVDHLSNGAVNNPDGFGWAIKTEHHILTGHGMSFDPVLENFLNARKKHGGPALFHSRITTHGNTSIDNCHPFRVGGDARSVLGHNGMLPIDVPKGDTRSDTAIFAQQYLPNIGGVYALDEPDTFAQLEKWATGSKLVVLTADPFANRDWYILNEKSGHWDTDGVWWSNSSYQTVYRSYGSYGSGWSGYVSKSTKSDNDYVTLLDEDDEAYYNLYQVVCPVCNTAEVYDFDCEDVDVCYTCGFCMWCETWGDDCDCWGHQDRQKEGPAWYKLSWDEVCDYLGSEDLQDIKE